MSTGLRGSFQRISQLFVASESSSKRDLKISTSSRSTNSSKRNNLSSARSTNSMSSAGSGHNHDNNDSKSVNSSKSSEKIAAPIEEIRAISRWIQFFCGSTDHKVCIAEVEELIMYPPLVSLEERYEIAGAMLTFQSMLQKCGMSPQEWYELVMRHDPVFMKKPVMLLPTFTKAMLKMCKEVSMTIMSDEQIRILYRYFNGQSIIAPSADAPMPNNNLDENEDRPETSDNSTSQFYLSSKQQSNREEASANNLFSSKDAFLQFHYVDQGFTAFDFAIAFAKHRVHDPETMQSYNQIAATMKSWANYLRESHLDLVVIGNISSKNMRSGILTNAELEKVLSTLYVKHQQYLKQVARPGYHLLSSSSLKSSSSSSTSQRPAGTMRITSTVLCKSTLGAAEEDGPEVSSSSSTATMEPSLLGSSSSDENSDKHVRHIDIDHSIPRRKASLLFFDSVRSIVQNVRASFALSTSTTADAADAGTPATSTSASVADAKQSHTNTITDSATTIAANAANAAITATRNTAGGVISKTRDVLKLTPATSNHKPKKLSAMKVLPLSHEGDSDGNVLRSGGSNNQEEEEDGGGNVHEADEMAERRRRRSVSHPLRYSALFTAA